MRAESRGRHQRCWVHRTANVLNKVALSGQLNMKADIREIYGRLSMPQSALGFAQFPLERAMWFVAAMVVDVRGD
jgi:transposase-like protein